jgi:Ni/Co efflux regulator RcnB
VKDLAIILLVLVILAMAASGHPSAQAQIDGATMSKADWTVCKREAAPPLPLQRAYQKPRTGGVA